MLSELADHESIGDLDGACGVLVEEGPGVDCWEINLCGRGSVEVSAHAAFDILRHLHDEFFEDASCGVVGDRLD